MLGLLMGLTGLSALLFIHPYLTYPASLLILRRRPFNPDASVVAPTATLVFCAYNESKSIGAKIENLQAIRVVAPDMKIACYVDLSSDDTVVKLREQEDWLTVLTATERTGKAQGMARLAAHCDTDIIIFTDANVLVEPKSIPLLLARFADPEVGGVCGTLVYTNPRASATAATNSAYWRLEELIKKRETLSGSTMGADGSIFATRRNLYPKVPPNLLDDLIVSMSVIFAGYRLISVPEVIAYERTAEASADEWRRKRRIACRAYASHRHISARVARLGPLHIYKYVSHRLLRWYGALSGTLAALFALTCVALVWTPGAALLVAALGALAAWIGIRFRLPLVKQGVEAMLAIYAAGLGVMDAWRGRTYQTWQPAQSR